MADIAGVAAVVVAASVAAVTNVAHAPASQLCVRSAPQSPAASLGRYILGPPASSQHSSLTVLVRGSRRFNQRPATTACVVSCVVSFPLPCIPSVSPKLLFEAQSRDLNSK